MNRFNTMNAFFWLVLLSVTWSSIGLCANSANHFSELPSPENFSLEKFENISLNLELVINQRATGLVAKVERVGDQFFLFREDLISVGVTAKSLPGTEERLEVTSIPGVNVRYLQSSLQLAIDVPPNWLPMQSLSAQDMGRFSPAQFGRGGLLNYNVFGVYENESRQKEVSINHEVRAFSEFGVFSTTGIFKSNFHRDVQSQQSSQYTRFDTSYEYVNQEKRIRMEVGDYIVRPLSWSQPVRLAGIQLSHDFSMRPDVVTTPLPAFYGEVTAPTTLDLFINGFKTDSMNVGPGPFIINDIPMLSGAGDELQGIKKGIMEMADALVITKADGDNVRAANRASQEYRNAMHLFPPNDNEWIPQVFTCSAHEGTNIERVFEVDLHLGSNKAA